MIVFAFARPADLWLNDMGLNDMGLNDVGRNKVAS